MKKLLLIFVTILFISCEKQPPIPLSERDVYKVEVFDNTGKELYSDAKPELDYHSYIENSGAISKGAIPYIYITVKHLNEYGAFVTAFRANGPGLLVTRQTMVKTSTGEL